MDPQHDKPTSQLHAADDAKLGKHFDHHRLDVWRVALEALLEGEAICKQLARGHGKLRDQLRRALQATSRSRARRRPARAPIALAAFVGRVRRLASLPRSPKQSRAWACATPSAASA